MSLQVGLACYADAAAAGAAACSQFGLQITSLSSGQIQSLSCLSADPVSGALTIQSSTAMPGSSPVIQTSIIQPVFQPCQYGDWMDAGIAIAVACLGVWVTIYGYQRLQAVLNWSRGNE